MFICLISTQRLSQDINPKGSQITATTSTQVDAVRRMTVEDERCYRWIPHRLIINYIISLEEMLMMIVK